MTFFDLIIIGFGCAGIGFLGYEAWQFVRERPWSDFGVVPDKGDCQGHCTHCQCPTPYECNRSKT